ncbi:hypothetical protein [Embleya sp. NPDC050493]|uniref:hypothetical protein n=1 Tax=Embleya sp. NPDC050493 TaxID=3363989 RepID=UPI0037ABCE24
MDQSETPVLAYAPFTPPGHKQGRGIDARTMAILGEDGFRSDLLATQDWTTGSPPKACRPEPRN